MKRSLGTVWLLFAYTITALSAGSELLDDRQIRIDSRADAESTRARLIQHVWGPKGFPLGKQPNSVRSGIPSPVQHLENLVRVDELRFDLHTSLSSIAYHFVSRTPNGSLVVVHHGHACTLDDDPAPTESGYGLQRTIRALLAEGYGVLGVFMPHMRPGDCTGQHEALFQIHTEGNPMKFFLEPALVGLNYLSSQHREGRFPRYRDFHMVGLSGGGWTTTICAAVDRRIRSSFSVAGTMPLYLRSGGSVGDLEQFEPSFYSMAGYPELYVLGCSDRKRFQFQIHVRKDDCCFGEKQHDARKGGGAYEASLRTYEAQVRSALGRMRGGSFTVFIDEVAPSHMISHHAIRDVILPKLRQARGK